MGLLGGLRLECYTFLRRHGNIELEYDYVISQISPNLMLNMNILYIKTQCFSCLCRIDRGTGRC